MCLKAILRVFASLNYTFNAYKRQLFDFSVITLLRCCAKNKNRKRNAKNVAKSGLKKQQPLFIVCFICLQVNHMS